MSYAAIGPSQIRSAAAALVRGAYSPYQTTPYHYVRCGGWA